MRVGLGEHVKVVGSSRVLIGVEGVEGEEGQTESPERQNGVHSVAAEYVALFNDLTELLNELRVDAVDGGQVAKDGMEDLMEIGVSDELAEGLL